MKQTTVLFFLLITQNINMLGQLNNLNPCFNILDTISSKENHVKIRATWMNDTIYLSRLTYPIKINQSIIRKIKSDSAFNLNQKEEENLKEFIQAASQNCYCYALEKYFNHNNLKVETIFNKDTHIAEESIQTILNSTFQITKKYKIFSNRNLKQEIENNVIIAFRNKNGNIVHLMFYLDNIIYSKNGAHFPENYNKLSKIYKVYKTQTESIEFYVLSDKKIDTFFNINN